MANNKCKPRKAKCTHCARFKSQVAGEHRISGFCERNGNLVVFKRRKLKLKVNPPDVDLNYIT